MLERVCGYNKIKEPGRRSTQSDTCHFGVEEAELSYVDQLENDTVKKIGWLSVKGMGARSRIKALVARRGNLDDL